MVASIDDRLKIMSMMVNRCNQNRMIEWVLNYMFRDIKLIPRKELDLTHVTNIEIAVAETWIDKYMNDLPYLRFYADATQICELVYHMNMDYQYIIELAFSSEINQYMGSEVHQFKQHYNDAIRIIFSEEVDEKLREYMIARLLNTSILSALLQLAIGLNKNKPYTTQAFYYDHSEVSSKLVDIVVGDMIVNDVSRSIIDAAIENSLQLIINVAMRKYLAVLREKIVIDAFNTPNVGANDYLLYEYQKLLNNVYKYDFITPTNKRVVRIGGEVINDDGTFAF